MRRPRPWMRSQGVGVRRALRTVEVAEALEADVQARRVHHDEHGRQAAMRLADQPAGGAVEAPSRRSRCP